MSAFLEEVYFIGVSARHKGGTIRDCPYRVSSKNGEAWLLGFHNAPNLPSYEDAVKAGINLDAPIDRES